MSLQSSLYAGRLLAAGAAGRHVFGGASAAAGVPQSRWCSAKSPSSSTPPPTSASQPPTPPTEGDKSVHEHLSEMRSSFEPDRLDRWILKNYGKYKSTEEIPKFVTASEIDVAKSKWRIRWNIYMIICTGLGCIYMVIKGKNTAIEDTISNKNIDQHRKWAEERKQRDAEAKKQQEN